MSNTGQPARKAALALLNGVITEHRMLVDVETRGSAFAGLEPADMARAKRLAAETLRWMDRADRVLGRYLRKMPPIAIMNILRLSVVELCQLDEASHGVVHDAVSLARNNRNSGKLAGLVNATLRKIAVEGPALWPNLPAPQLPKWMRKQLVSTYGKAVVSQIELAHSRAAPLDLTPKDGDTTRLAKLTGGHALTGGSVRLQNSGRVSELPGYAEGEWWVQDTAAAMPARILAPQPGETILDLCAAPGGKTMQLAALGSTVTALDQSAERLTRVSENLNRIKLSASIIKDDALNHVGSYDAVVLDAPCSATGTIRRHPDLPHIKSAEGISDLIALQAKLLDHAATLLKPGGRLVYCTCSLLPDEGENQIVEFLSRNDKLAIDHPTCDWIEEEWRSSEGGLRLRPDYWSEIGGMDGFYMALLRKD